MNDKTQINQTSRETKYEDPVDSTGANAEAQLTTAANQPPTITFGRQVPIYLDGLKNSRRKRVSAGTLFALGACSSNWLSPAIGDLLLSEIDNEVLRSVAAAMSARGLSLATIQKYVQVVKAVVASALDAEGNEIYPKTWNNNFIGMPLIARSKQNTPCFSPQIMSGLAMWKHERERTLFTVCGASGLRIGEVRALEIDKHFSADFSTLTIEQTVTNGVEHRVKTQASFRKVDLHPKIATLLKKFAGKRKSGFLFCSSKGTPLELDNILIKHLHPALEELGFVNPATHTHKAGTHTFRRFRHTQLNRTACPQSLQKFWMGHADDSRMAAHFNKNQVYRKGWAEKCGVGFELPPTAPSEPEVEGDQSGSKAA